MARQFSLVLLIATVLAPVAFAQDTGELTSITDELKGLIDRQEFDALLSRYSALSSREDFAEIEATLLELAKDQVVASRYDVAVQVLEILLNVNLFNLEAQDVYVSVQSLLKGRVPGSDAKVVSRIAEPVAGTATGGGTGGAVDSTPPTAAPAPSPGPLSAAPVVAATAPASPTAALPTAAAQESPSPDSPAPQPTAEQAAAVPERASATPASPAETPTESAVSATVAPSAPAPHPAADGVDQSEAAVAGGTTVVGPSLAEPPPVTVEPLVASRPPVPTSYRAFVGPVSLLGNASAFYTDFYGSARLDLAWGVSADALLLFHLPRLTIGPEVSVDGHFLQLTAGGGDHISYKVSVNVGLPVLTSFPLFVRTGFTQQWYLFGTDIPDVLITRFPSPTFGVRLNEIPLGDRVTLSATADMFAIAFFTSYFAFGMDSTIEASLSVPISERLTLYPRIAARPQILIAFGNVEFLGKLELGLGIVSHEP